MVSLQCASMAATGSLHRDESAQRYLQFQVKTGVAVTRTEWDFDTTLNDDARDDLLPKSPEELADRFGTRSALMVLCLAFFIAAIWFVNSPSFEKCSAVMNTVERDVCYERLRTESLKPPAKGAVIPWR